MFSEMNQELPFSAVKWRSFLVLQEDLIESWFGEDSSENVALQTAY